MMMQMARGGGMPGMPGVPGMRRDARRRQARQGQAAAKKGKGAKKSGNPAKAAQEAAAAKEKAAAAAANPFGNPRRRHRLRDRGRQPRPAQGLLEVPQVSDVAKPPPSTVLVVDGANVVGAAPTAGGRTVPAPPAASTRR